MHPISFKQQCECISVDIAIIGTVNIRSKLNSYAVASLHPKSLAANFIRSQTDKSKHIYSVTHTNACSLVHSLTHFASSSAIRTYTFSTYSDETKLIYRFEYRILIK